MENLQEKVGAKQVSEEGASSCVNLAPHTHSYTEIILGFE